jgi:hypothetical protein
MPGTLRWAVNQANSMPGSTVVFDVPGIIHLNQGEIQIHANMTICGMDEMGNPVNVTIDGSHRDRIFEIDPGENVILCDLTLRNGYAHGPGGSGPGLGGAILNYGNLCALSVNFDSNIALVNGGAIETVSQGNSAAPGGASLYVGTFVTATFTGNQSTFTGNHAEKGFGGAISTNDPQREETGPVIIFVDNSRFVANTANLATGGGGAIDFDMPYYVVGSGGFGNSSLTVTDSSSFQGNEAADGGAIYVGPGFANNPAFGGSWTVNIVSSTFDSNDATGALTPNPTHGFGGAIDLSQNLYQNTSATTLICGCTLTENTANFGGAISTVLRTNNFSTATVTIDQDAISSNFAVNGGGIYNDVDGESRTATGGPGRLTAVYVTNSTVDDNGAASSQTSSGAIVNGLGGGIYCTARGTMNTILEYINDTVAFNSAVNSGYAGSVGDGGGIYLTGSNPNQAELILLNSLTVAYNYADYQGGGLWLPLGMAGTLPPPLGVWVRNCAFCSNTVPAPINGPNVYGTVTTKDYNIVSNPMGSSGWGPLDILFVSCQLDTALAFNGGPTMTLWPQAASPVIGTGFPVPLAAFDDPTYDQRGFTRAGPTSRGAVDPNSPDTTSSYSCPEFTYVCPPPMYPGPGG